MLAGYVVAIMLARGLQPADFGTYGVIVSAIVWFQVVVAAGIPAASSKLISDQLGEARQVETSARFLLLTLALLLFLVAWSVAPLIARLFDIRNGAVLVRIALLDVPLTAMYAAYQGALVGHRRFGPLALAHVLYGAAKVVGVSVLLWLGLSIKGALLINVAATATALVFLLLRFPPTVFRPDRDAVRLIIGIAIPMGLYLIGQQVLLSLDLWSLKALWRGGEEVVGHYVASLTIAKTLLLIPVVQSAVVFAVTAWALARRDETGAKEHVFEASRFALILAGPAAVIVALHASPLLGLLFSDAYSAGGRFLALHLAAFGLFGFLDVYVHCLLAAGRQHLAAIVVLIVLPVVAVANWSLIPALGPIGAAISLVLGVAIGTIIAGGLTYRRFGGLVRPRTLVNVLLTVVVIAVGSRLIHVGEGWLLLKMAGLEGVALLLLWLLGEVEPADFTLKGAPDETSQIHPEPT